MIRAGAGATLALLASVAPAAAQGSASPVLPGCNGPSVELRAVEPRVPAGTRPAFSVAVVNASAEAVRVPALDRRADLQTAYAELRVEQDGRPVDVRVLIADPGPVSDEDYVRLVPGERLTIQPLNYRRMLGTLPAGAYTAHVVFWRDPLDLTTRCRLSDAAFSLE